MTAYYNEIDPYAAQWLRNLIAAGHIAPGDVDERSIVDVQADDLKGYTQCHFFAGIGGWSYAVRLAGWPDERPMWSASCPCQPYSLAGKGLGQEDERDLWPVLYRLVDAQRPPVLVGEQVKDAIGKHWLDRMRVDLERSGYSLGATVLPACSVDAPHKRDRLWIVAESDSCVRDGWAVVSQRGQEGRTAIGRSGAGHFSSAVADPQSFRSWAGFREGDEKQNRNGIACRGRADGVVHIAVSAGLEGYAGHVDDRNEPRRIDAHQGRPTTATGGALSNPNFAGEGQGREQRGGQFGGAGSNSRNSAWVGAEWAIGSDGKARRFEPGICLLAHGVPARVGKLRAYGNAIVPQVAAEVIGAYMEIAA